MAPYLITTSWDDGSPHDLRLAGLLRKYGLQGTFYVPIRPEAPVLSRPEIRALAEEFEVGAHTVRHIPLTHLSCREAAREMAVSRAELESITGRACPLFCFPRGKHRNAHLGLAAETGFEACRTVGMLSLGQPVSRARVLLMGTSVQAFPHSHAALARNILRRASMAGARNWVNCGMAANWVELAKRLLQRAIECGGVFHLWGHSWEIEAMGQWTDLESLFRHVIETADPARCVTNGAVCEAAKLPREAA